MKLFCFLVGLFFMGISCNAGYASLEDQLTAINHKLVNWRQYSFDQDRKADDLFLEIYEDFNTMSFEEGIWQAYATTHNLYKWPLQTTWKQVVGGHVFYPPYVNEYQDSVYNTHLLQRVDNLWRFALSAKCQHTLGKFQLVENLYARYVDMDPKDEVQGFYLTFFEQAVKECAQSTSHPDACYALGECFSDCLKSQRVTVHISGEQIYDWLKSHNVPRNHYKALSFNRRKGLPFAEPADRFELAKTLKYGAGCFNASRSSDLDLETRRHYVDTALKLGFMPALLSVGYRYDAQGDFTTALGYYQQAIDHGYYYGYIIQGKTLVGDVRHGIAPVSRPNLSTIEPANIDKAAAYFTLAGQAGDPDGWRYLVCLYECQYNEQGFKRKSIGEQETLRQKIEGASKHFIQYMPLLGTYTSEDFKLTLREFLSKMV